MNTSMYENHKLCPELKAKELCIVIEQYNNGLYKRLFHRHIKQHRLSEQSRSAMLSAFVVKCSGIGLEQIVSAYVNKRGRDPVHSNTFISHASYPEPGVLRHYCGTNTTAWIDQVISPSKFRKQKTE